MHKFTKHVIMFALGVASAGAYQYARATPGGVNADGCHDSKKIGYHCHANRAKSGGLPGGETNKERNQRLKNECRGGVNAGACAGLTR